MSETPAQKLEERTAGTRILALDAMRGLAALVVVTTHFSAAFLVPLWYILPVDVGHTSVILFFVLSGYVLSIPYWSGRQLPYPRYLLRRFFRIYVPYAAAICVAVIVGSHMLNAQLPLSAWFYRTWHDPMTRRLVLRQFVTMSINPKINTAFWSLRYEMEMSIVFPLICWLLFRLRPWGGLITALAMEKGGLLLVNRALSHSGRDSVEYEIAETLIYASSFFLGALLAWQREPVARLYHRTPRWLKIVLLLLVFFLYFNSRESLLPFGACGALIFAEHSRVSRWLDTPVPEYLGRISYSLYLIHATVLFAILILLYGKVPVIALFAIYLVVAFAVSHLFCIAVEEPSMRAGKRLTALKRITPSSLAPAPIRPSPMHT